MATAQPNTYYLSVKLNEIELTDQEVTYLNFTRFIGNQMPTCKFDLISNRSEIHDSLLVEMSVVEVEIGTADSRGGPADTKKGRFFVGFVKRRENLGLGKISYSVYCIADARKYIEEPQIMSVPARQKSLKFLQRLSSFGSNSKGSGKLKLYIEDDLLSRSNDEQFWIQRDLSDIETVNETILRAGVSQGEDYIMCPVVDFDSSGGPVLHIYDLKTRCQSFEPKNLSLGVPFNAHFSQGESRVLYNDIRLQILGAEHSIKYWKRQSATLDTEEQIANYKEVKQPKLFSDSLTYSEQIVFDGNSDIPSTFPMLKSGERLLWDGLNTNHYDPQYISRRLQYGANMLALMKLNLKMSFLQKFVDASPIDIAHVSIQKNEGAVGEVNNRLTTKWCTTRVSWVYSSRTVSSYITVSRDSYSPNSTTRRPSIDEI